VDTHIRRLRQKLSGYAKLVETVRGVGYRFSVRTA
jgi:two-component system phosphate regulon response regulator PhoB